MTSPLRAARSAHRRGRLLALTAAAGLAAAVLPAALGSPAAQAAPATVKAAAAPGSDDVWTPVTGRAARPSGDDRRVNPSEYRSYTLDDAALGAVLGRAPMQGSGARGTLVSVPAPSGDLVDFRVVEAPVMEAGLAAAHPEITTYAGRTTSGSAASIRLDVTPMGFHASVRGEGASWYVDPAYNGDDSLYLSYLGTDLPAAEKNLVEPDLGEDAPKVPASTNAGEEAQGDAVIHRTYRLALVTDPSYARYFGTENVLAEKVTLMNRVNQIYNDDLAINMVLVDDEDKLNIDTAEKAFGPDGGCGPNGCYAPNQFDNGCTGSLLNRNLYALSRLVGPENYDIGHIMLGINGGGVAGLGVVGGNGKARGCTGLPQPEGDFMAIDYVAHEMGHQFGGNHTFNGTQVNCGGNKAAPSVEPGSGSSVMAYAGICGQDDLQPHTDPYFSQWSQQEMSAYITSSPTVNEVQTVSLEGFDTDGESFTLTYDGETTDPIVRGTNYTTTGIRDAIIAILPENGSVSVSAFGGSGALTDAGFQLTFSTPFNAPNPNPLAGTDLELFQLNPGEGVAGDVSETTKGAMLTNGGFETEDSANHTPEVTSPETTTIPLRTPFALTGSATDSDGDDMVYLWEQSDRGAGRGTSLVDQVKTNGPLFRVFGTYADVTPAGTLFIDSPGENHADDNPTRVFPDMEQILANNTNAATGTCPTPPAAPASGPSNVPIPTRDCFSEWLPTADYVGSPQAGNDTPLALDFRFTARDLDPAAGGYAFADTKLLIDNTAGPFLVSSKNTPAAAIGTRTEAVNWSVAGTNKPELAENVKISLSTDGGETFPIVLAESTPNDGTEPVTWPNVNTEHARIKIEAVDNVFFDVNNADFAIVALDDTAPETTVEAGSADGAVAWKRTVAYQFGSDEEDVTFTCTLDGEPADCEDGLLVATGLASGTHVVTAAATDGAGNTDATPVQRISFVPVDDRDLGRGGQGWTDQTSNAAFDGTLSVAKTKRQRLVTDVTDATGIGLVAPKNKRFGRVQVIVDGDVVKTVNLRSQKSRGRTLTPVYGAPDGFTGRVVIRTLDAKVVKIDGLVVTTDPTVAPPLEN